VTDPVQPDHVLRKPAGGVTSCPGEPDRSRRVSATGREVATAAAALLPPEPGSGDPDVRVLVRELPLFLGQLGFLDRGRDRPVLADRATLKSPPAHPKRLQGSSRNPDRRIQVTLPAADDQIAADRVPAKLHRDRFEQEGRDDDEQTAPTRDRGRPPPGPSVVSHNRHDTPANGCARGRLSAASAATATAARRRLTHDAPPAVAS